MNDPGSSPPHQPHKPSSNRNSINGRHRTTNNRTGQEESSDKGNVWTKASWRRNTSPLSSPKATLKEKAKERERDNDKQDDEHDNETVRASQNGVEEVKGDKDRGKRRTWKEGEPTQENREREKGLKAIRRKKGKEKLREGEKEKPEDENSEEEEDREKELKRERRSWIAQHQKNQKRNKKFCEEVQRATWTLLYTFGASLTPGREDIQNFTQLVHKVALLLPDTSARPILLVYPSPAVLPRHSPPPLSFLRILSQRRRGT